MTNQNLEGCLEFELLELANCFLTACSLVVLLPFPPSISSRIPAKTHSVILEQIPRGYSFEILFCSF